MNWTDQLPLWLIYTVSVCGPAFGLLYLALALKLRRSQQKQRYRTPYQKR